MTTNQLNLKLNRLLKAFLMKEGHIKTGDLYRSIDFKTSYKDGDFDIKLDARFYIEYLQKGEFMDKFIKLPDVVDVVSDFLVSKLSS